MVHLSHLYMTTGKIIVLTIQTFVDKVMSLLLYTLSTFVIAFLPRSKCLLVSWLAVTICSDFGALENKICHCFHFVPIYLPWSDRIECHDVMPWILWMLNFKPAFSLYSSPSSIGSLVPLHFLPLEWYHLYIWSCWYFLWQSWFSLWFMGPSIAHDVLYI